MEKGQVDVRLAWDKMEPAVLFAGNITSYSVWAITRDGRPENIGELPVREKKSGEATFRTGKANFAIIVTAEVLPGTLLPSELVVFTSGKVDEKTTREELGLPGRHDEPLPEFMRPGNPSIADLTYTGEGRRADRAAAGPQGRRPRHGAEGRDRRRQGDGDREEASSRRRRTRRRGRLETGRRRLLAPRPRQRRHGRPPQGAGDARPARRGRAAAARAAEEKKRQELEATKARAAAAEADKARMAAEVTRMKAEQEQLKAGLREAVGKYMQVEETARGLVVNMGDILFDVNKSTLKKDSRARAREGLRDPVGLPEAPDPRRGLHGHDRQGRAQHEALGRACSTVADFLVAQGVAAERLTHAGYGPANPVGDNATAEGRKKNRRVELILNQGPVTATPGGMVAPEAGQGDEAGRQARQGA